MSIRGKVLVAFYTAQNIEMISSAREPSLVVTARRLGWNCPAGVGQTLKSFTCLPISAVTGPGALHAAACCMPLLTHQLQETGGEDFNDPGSGNHPVCNGSVHFGRSGPSPACANPASPYIKLLVSYSAVPTS